MIIYERADRHSDSGTVLSWHSSKRDAERMRLPEDCDPKYIGIYKHEIKPTKAAMLNWLNVHVKTDNG